MLNRIKHFRRLKKLTQQQLADILGIHLTNLNRLENGKAVIDLARLQQIAEALEVSQSDLVSEEGGSRNTVKVMGFIGAGAQVFPVDGDGDDNFIDEVELDFPMPPGTVTAIVRGDSMLPVFEDGDLIGYYRDTVDPYGVIGRQCVVKVVDGPMYLKTVKRGVADGLFTLSSFNASDMEDVALEWAAPFQFRVSRFQWRRI